MSVSVPDLLLALLVVSLVSRATFEAAKYGRVSRSVLVATIAGVLVAITVVCLTR